MREDFEDYFNWRYAIYTNSYYPRRLSPRYRYDDIDAPGDDIIQYARSRIGRIIEDSLSSAKMFWRADARLFLATNIYENVVAPFIFNLEAVGAEGPVWVAVEKDTLRIVRWSEMEAGERTRDYVSGTSVMKAISNIIEELASTAENIWD